VSWLSTCVPADEDGSAGAVLDRYADDAQCVTLLRRSATSEQVGERCAERSARGLKSPCGSEICRRTQIHRNVNFENVSKGVIVDWREKKSKAAHR